MCRPVPRRAHLELAEGHVAEPVGRQQVPASPQLTSTTAQRTLLKTTGLVRTMLLQHRSRANFSASQVCTVEHHSQSVISEHCS